MYHALEHDVIFYFQVGSTFRICTEPLKVHFQSGSVPGQVTRHSDGWQQFPGVLRSPSWKWRKERKGAETVMNYERGRKGRQGNSKGYVIFIQRLQSLGHHSFIIDTFPINFSTVLEECRTVHCNIEQRCTHFLWKKHFFFCCQFISSLTELLRFQSFQLHTSIKPFKL